jgi:outer membrane receptor for ferrienterochelin and colicins
MAALAAHLAFAPDAGAAPDPREGQGAPSTAPAATVPTVDVEDSRLIVVTGTRTPQRMGEGPVATEVLDREDVETSGAENLAELLEEAPGVRVTGGFAGAGVSLQGLEPKDTLILIDGLRIPGRVGGTLDLRRIPAEAIERVEIVKGGASVLYGADAVGGVINVITRRTAAPLEAEVHGSYGSFSTWDGTARVAVRRGRVWVAAVGGGHGTAGFDRDPSDAQTTGNAIHQANANVQVGVRGRGASQLSATLDWLLRDQRGVDSDVIELGDDRIEAIYDRRNLTQTFDARLAGLADLDDGARAQFAVAYGRFSDQFLSDQRGDDDGDVDERTVEDLAQLQLQYDAPLPRGHQLTFAIDALAEWLTSDRIDEPRAERARLGSLVQHQWSVAAGERARFVVLPAVRVDVDTLFGAYPVPRLAVMLTSGPRFTLRASYGRSFRAPSFREMYLRFANPAVGYIVQGNPALQPETAWSAQWSIEGRPAPWLTLSATLFDHQQTDAIIVDTVAEAQGPSPTLFGYVNVGQASVRGLETSLLLEPWAYVALEGSWTGLRARDLDERRALPGRPTHAGQASLLLRTRVERWETRLRLRSAITGARPFYFDTDGDGVEGRVDDPAFATLDARIDQSLTRYASVFVGADNLLDAGNATTNPLTPRGFYGGATLRW